jgi:hypothetical protein
MEGVRSTATAFDPRRERLRVPRCFSNSDCTLRPYDEGRELLAYVEGGAFHAEEPLFSRRIADHRVVVVSPMRVLVATPNGQFLGQMALDRVAMARAAGSVVHLLLKRVGETDFKIPCASAAAAAQLAHQLGELLSRTVDRRSGRTK